MQSEQEVHLIVIFWIHTLPGQAFAHDKFNFYIYYYSFDMFPQ